jgi:glutaminase
MAGGLNVGFSNSVFLSERDTADRNHAIAYFMREQKCFPRSKNTTLYILTYTVFSGFRNLLFCLRIYCECLYFIYSYFF